LITSHKFYFSLIRFAWRCDSRKWKNANFVITHGVLPRVGHFFLKYEGNNRVISHSVKKNEGIMMHKKQLLRRGWVRPKVDGIWKSVIFGDFVNTVVVPALGYAIAILKLHFLMSGHAAFYSYRELSRYSPERMQRHSVISRWKAWWLIFILSIYVKRPYRFIDCIASKFSLMKEEPITS